MALKSRIGLIALAGALAIAMVAVPADVVTAQEPAAVGVDTENAAAAGGGESLAQTLAPGFRSLGDGRYAVPLSTVGLGLSLRLTGEVSESVFNLPVVDGTRAIELRAALTTSPDVEGGYIEYSAPGAPSGLVDLGRFDPRPYNSPVVLDLSGTVPTNNRLPLKMSSRLRSSAPPCLGSLAGAWVEFRNAELILEGDPSPPQSVAGFLPGLLERLIILIPAEPTPAEVLAAVRAAQVATRSTLGGSPLIEVQSIPGAESGGGADLPDGPFSPNTRTIAISEGFEAGARLVPLPGGDRVLVLGGDAADLGRLSGTLASELARLAVGEQILVERFDPIGAGLEVPEGVEPLDDEAAAEAGPVGLPDPAVRIPRVSFSELGFGAKRSSGFTEVELNLFVDQAALGGPMSSARVHLEGTFTPIAEGAAAAMSLYVNSQMVQSRNLGGVAGEERDGKVVPGAFSFDYDLPAESVRRNLDVQILVDYSPVGSCGPGSVPFTMQLDPANSFVRVDEGTVLKPGFERFPQALMPGFELGLDRWTVDRAEHAVRLVSVLQRGLNRFLQPNVVPLDEAVATGRTAVLIGAASSAMDADAPALMGDPVSARSPQRVELLRLQTDVPFAVLQAYENRGRDRLMLLWSGGSADEAAGQPYVDELMAGMSGRTRRFTSLVGDTYLAAEGAPPLSFSLLGEAPQPQARRETPDYIGRAIPLVIAAFVVSLVILGLVLLRRRRLRQAGLLPPRNRGQGGRVASRVPQVMRGVARPAPGRRGRPTPPDIADILEWDDGPLSDDGR